MVDKATKFVDLQGKCKWAKVHTPDSKFGKPSYKIVLYPNPASLKIIQDLKKDDDKVKGIMNKLGMDDDGPYMNFSRPVEMQMRTGDKRTLTPPRIVKSDGTSPHNDSIGNGSDVTVRVELYKANVSGKPTRVARLEAIKVDNLVPYERERDASDLWDKRVVAGMDKLPPQTPSW